MLTKHERELVYQAQVAKAYSGTGLKSHTIRAVLRDLNEREFEQVKECHTFAEIMDRVGEIKSRRKAA